MVALYTLIAAADLEGNRTNTVPTKAAPTKKKSAAKKTVAKTPRVETNDGVGENAKNRRPDPELNINVQIHISSDASAEQVDQIFKSMAEHLYGGE